MHFQVKERSKTVLSQSFEVDGNIVGFCQLI